MTRDSPPAWSGAVGRIDLSMLKRIVERLVGMADILVCGPAGFVEIASALLLDAGQPGEAIRPERFGPIGA